MDRIKTFASRVHIDLMDGEFAKTSSPPLDSIWWYDFMQADIHLMYARPADALESIKKLKPSLVVIHAEAEVDHEAFAKELHAQGIKAGLALLQNTEIDDVAPIARVFDHILIFSGNLGHHGGTADIKLISKLHKAKELYPDKELAWDGGINDQNIKELLANGANVLNVGGFIQDSADPFASYAKLRVFL